MRPPRRSRAKRATTVGEEDVRDGKASETTRRRSKNTTEKRTSTPTRSSTRAERETTTDEDVRDDKASETTRRRSKNTTEKRTSTPTRSSTRAERETTTDEDVRDDKASETTRRRSKNTTDKRTSTKDAVQNRDLRDESHDDVDQELDDMKERFGGDVPDVAAPIEGPSITTVEQHADLPRNPSVEALWFRLSNPDFITTAFVPVPGVTSVEARQRALELAKVGASITGQPVHVITAVGLQPSETAETGRNIAESHRSQAIVVVESPSVDPGSIPILRSCPRSVLLVGLERSRGDELERITDIIGAENVFGSVCLKPRKRRRWWNLRR